jgi:hypothetical protein
MKKSLARLKTFKLCFNKPENFREMFRISESDVHADAVDYIYTAAR